MITFSGFNVLGIISDPWITLNEALDFLRSFDYNVFVELC